MEEDHHQKELQLLPTRHPTASSSSKYRSMVSDVVAPSLDLQLSISVRPIHHHQIHQPTVLSGQICDVGDETSCVEALKWQAAEQIRLAAIERAYAERVRELTKREMELAQSEFTRAKQMWERAREEVEKAERMKERATRRIDSTCMEITCQSCRQRFRPWNQSIIKHWNGKDTIKVA